MSETWTRDTALVLALAGIVLSLRNEAFLWVSVVLLLALLIAPASLNPLGMLWFKVSKLLGLVMGRVFFGLVFFLVITPIGLIKRATARNREVRTSAFHELQEKFGKAQLLKPY